MSDSELTPPTCSETVAFSDGVDAVLDIANAIGGKVEKLRVADVSPGIVDLFAAVRVVIPRQIEHVAVSYQIKQ